MKSSRPIRIVALMEASSVSGPAKNLIRFSRRVRELSDVACPVEVSIATFHRVAQPGDTLETPFTRAIKAAGVTVDVIPESFRMDPRVIGKLRALLDSRGADIIQTHGVKSHFLVYCAGLHRGRRWIAYHHGYTAEDLKMRLYNRLNRISLPAAHRVITVCRPFARQLEETGVHPSRIAVLRNTIDPQPAPDPSRVAQLRAHWGIAPEEIVLLCVGRFSTEKAQADLVPTLLQLKQTLRDVPLRLVLVGDGIEHRNLEHAFRQSGLAKAVVFAGHQAQLDVYYGMANLFVLPSHSEGSPNVVLEAMAAGVPIVATAVGGVPETVSHEHSALLVEASQPVRMAEAIARLVRDPELATRLKEAALLDVGREFSPDFYCRSLASIYCEEAARREMVV